MKFDLFVNFIIQIIEIQKKEMSSNKSLIKYPEFKSIVKDSSELNRAVRNGTYVLFNEEQLTSEIADNLEGITIPDVKRIFRGSEIVGTNKKRYYCAKVGFLMDLLY